MALRLSRGPRLALVLGYAGLVPFAACTLALWGQQHMPFWPVTALRGLVGYGAVILSFLGGIIWGLALERDRPGLYVLAVVPSLIGWAALVLAPVYGLALLAAAFIAQYFVDRRLTGDGLMPGWMMPMRLHLTAGASALLLAGLAGWIVSP